jgi:hypothetical protein
LTSSAPTTSAIRISRSQSRKKGVAARSRARAPAAYRIEQQGGDHHHVSRQPIPQPCRAQFHGREQLLLGGGGTGFRPETQQAADQHDQHDQQDDHAIDGRIQPKRHAGRYRQNQGDRVAELMDQPCCRPCL